VPEDSGVKEGRTLGCFYKVLAMEDKKLPTFGTWAFVSRKNDVIRVPQKDTFRGKYIGKERKTIR
jgi:hypothetical protein